MKHIDANSLKHIGVCALGSFLGTHGAAFVMGAAVCKEWQDSKQHGNHWCWSDLACDCIGCAIGLTAHYLVFGSWTKF